MAGLDDIVVRLREIDAKIAQVRHEAEVQVAELESDRRTIARELAAELKAAGLEPGVLAGMVRPTGRTRKRQDRQYQLVWKRDKSPVLDASGRPFVFQNRMNKIRNARARAAVGNKWSQVALLDCQNGQLLPDIISGSEE